MHPERLRNCTAPGRSILIGSVDADGFPFCCRAIALATDEEFTRATVYIPVATGHETIANVATTQRLAVSSSFPLDNSSVQLKGSTRAVRLARADERALVEEKLEEFAGVLELIGLPRRITRSMAHWPAFAIEMHIEEIFDQTPGPRAGDPLR